MNDSTALPTPQYDAWRLQMVVISKLMSILPSQLTLRMIINVYVPQQMNMGHSEYILYTNKCGLMYSILPTFGDLA